MAAATLEDTKRRAYYLAVAVTRGDKSAIAALEHEYPGEAKRIEGYRKIYWDKLHPQHNKMVADVAGWYERAEEYVPNNGVGNSN